MACAVGSAVLEVSWLCNHCIMLNHYIIGSVVKVIDEEGLQENSARVGEVFMRELMKLRDEFEVVGDVRGKGLMIGVELVKDRVCSGGTAGSGQPC